MGNKIFYGIVALIIVAFVGIFIFMNSASNDPDKISDSGYYPYTDLEPEELEGATIDKLDDENYHFNKTFDETKKIIEEEDNAFVYLWSPTCVHCIAATPFLADAFEQTDAEVTQLNVLEYDAAWSEFEIEGTPTLIYFEDGKEVDRLYGNPGNSDDYKSFIEDMTGDK
ncbi:hypothetical protein GCM10022378_10890 [Salinicoccus jeotgali]|uniref:Thioredoxin domain-containing protein n=1 Tax=Salinicoccus jeotgali TaxID=381634 RepID=A0ABP7EPY2_9STAP